MSGVVHGTSVAQVVGVVLGASVAAGAGVVDSGGAATTIPVPAGFRWSSPPITPKRLSGAISTAFDITTLIPAVTKKYYLDPVNGLDTNTGANPSGGAPNGPLQHLSVALAKSDVDQIEITGLTADYVALTSFAWNNVQPTRSLSVLNRTGFRFISMQVSSGTLPTWTVNGSFANVYQCARTAANSSSVVDLLTSSTPQYVNQGGTTVNAPNVPKRFRTLVNVASIAAVAATAGTWFNDATNTYVRSFDDRNLIGDTKMFPCATVNNGRFPSVNNCVIYVENVDFVGGIPFRMLMASTVTGTVAAFNKCTFQGGGGSATNGLNIACFGTVYSVNCGAYDNWLDGFSYHSNESDGTTVNTSPSCIEIGCCAVGNGLTGSGGSSDNCSSAHDQTNLIRVNPVYITTADRSLIDIDNAQSWNLGGFIGQSVIGNTGGENIVCGGGVAATTTKMWLDTVYAQPGSFNRWACIVASGGGATIFHSNSGPVVNDGSNTGAITPYAAG